MSRVTGFDKEHETRVVALADEDGGHILQELVGVRLAQVDDIRARRPRDVRLLGPGLTLDTYRSSGVIY